MAEVRIKDIDEHEIDTILAEDIDFEGHLTFKKPLMIKGKFKGEIKSTSSLYIGEKAFVEATTEAGIVSSKGRHKGNIVGHSRVELFSTAQVDGDIATPDFVVESGCKFNGYCNMGGGTKKEAQHPQHAAAARDGDAGRGQAGQEGRPTAGSQPGAGNQHGNQQQPQQRQHGQGGPESRPAQPSGPQQGSSPSPQSQTPPSSPQGPSQQGPSQQGPSQQKPPNHQSPQGGQQK